MYSKLDIFSQKVLNLKALHFKIHKKEYKGQKKNRMGEFGLILTQ